MPKDVSTHNYLKIVKLLPELATLKKKKAPHLLVASLDKLPVNVHLTAKSEETATITMGSYPIEENGYPIPSPEVEMKIDFSRKEAIPLKYADSKQRLERHKLTEVEKEKMDCTVYTWLLMLERLGFGLERDFVDPDCPPFPEL